MVRQGEVTIQFELLLSEKAEQLYDLLPAKVKTSFAAATEALQARLNPVRREALVSAQLVRRRQRIEESVDSFAQDFEKLFDASYGRRSGMDEESKELLKRDLFTQGLKLKWQEKILPTAKSFNDALHLARAAEEQEKQLAALHPGQSTQKSGASRKPSDKRESPLPTPPTNQSPTGSGGNLRCHKCGSLQHLWRDCPQRQPPSDTPGRAPAMKSSKSASAKSSAVTSAPHLEESEEDRCDRLLRKWLEAEH